MIPPDLDLGRAALEPLLQSQRWFASKDKSIADITIADEAEVAFDGEPARLLAAEVNYDDGSIERYFLPLIREESESASWIDGLSSDRFCRGMLTAIAQNHTIATKRGQIAARSTPVFTESPESIARLTVNRGTAEQSNSNIIYGAHYLLKWFRKLEEGPNPDLELGLHLANRLAPGRVPPIAGSFVWNWGGRAPSSLGLLQGFVPNQGSAWDWGLGEFQRSWSLRAKAEEALAGTQRMARLLGFRTAEMHQALADSPDPEFTPEAIDDERWSEMRSELELGLRTGIAAARSSREPQAQAIAEQGEALLHRLTDWPRPSGAVAIRCHGDYHLGQVLTANGDFVILDFEGEPAAPLAQRRSKKPPLKDVAGMLRSFDYAGVVGAAALKSNDPALGDWARVWTDEASAAFLDGYRGQAPASLLPEEPDFSRLLNLSLIEKAFYELRYELSNRPDWVYVPSSALLRLLAAV